MFQHCEFRWYRYEIPGGRKVYLTVRPDRVDPAKLLAWEQKHQPGLRLCFCDDYVLPSAAPQTPWHWLPWVPGQKVSVTTTFAALTLMSRFDANTVEYRPLWLHCDSSSMRAPTFFGLYLQACHPSLVRAIDDSVVKWNDQDLPPMLAEYSELAMMRDPGIGDLITHWRQGGEQQAYAYYMGRD
jgi:hypothetical protein